MRSGKARRLSYPRAEAGLPKKYLFPPWKEKRIEDRRSSRRDETDAERRLWSLLRSRPLDGFKFRRRRAIGPFIVDFCCFDKKLVLELDGVQHSQQELYDRRRTQYMNRHGFTVLRFWDNEVLQNTESVMSAIQNQIQKPVTKSGKFAVVR